MSMYKRDDLGNEFFEMSFGSYFFVDEVVVERFFEEIEVCLRLSFVEFSMRKQTD